MRAHHTFITEDFLLHTSTARALYHEYGKTQPIIDFHSHLPPKQVAENYQFTDLGEMWLGNDHYKWRAMRANGEPENVCSGSASSREKFNAWARTVPYLLRNPLYHWTHLELKHYFGIELLLSPATADEIWAQASGKIAGGGFTVHEILARENVEVVCTTDDPVDSLEWHSKYRNSPNWNKTRMYPTFRPDRAFNVVDPIAFRTWVSTLEQVSGLSCSSFAGFLKALEKRHEYFHSLGCRMSDHGLASLPPVFASDESAAEIYMDCRGGREVSAEKASAFAGNLMIFFGELDAKRGWTKQLHLGPIRNNRTRLFETAGPDAGADSIGDYPQAVSLSRYLDALDRRNALPKMILYNLDPSESYAVAAMGGNFQDGSVPGKIQYGAAWWFLDQKEGIERQLNTLSNLGLLRRFVGMLTDSRSFLSYTRHDYFRRILCNVIGTEVEKCELPSDLSLLSALVKEICYDNARTFLGLNT